MCYYQEVLRKNNNTRTLCSFRGLMLEGHVAGFFTSLIRINDVEKRYTCKKLNQNYQGTEKVETNERCFSQ